MNEETNSTGISHKLEPHPYTDDMVNDVINKLVDIRKIDEDQGEFIFWLHRFIVENKTSNEKVANKLGISSGQLSGIFTGNYQAKDWSRTIDKIKALKNEELNKENVLDLGFVMTNTAKTIFAACEGAMTDGMPAFIYGASQIGKTTALEEFKRTHNEGLVRYLRVGSNWTKARFVRELGKAVKVIRLPKKTTWEIEDGIFDKLNRHILLIVDEFHLCMETVSDATSREIVELIREVYDRTRCGLVLSSTKLGRDDLEGGKNAMLFDQMRRRGVIKVVLPDVPPLKDINAIAKSFGLELPKGDVLAKVKALLRTRGLGVFVKYLQKAHALAGKEPMTWDRFFYVNDGYAALAEMESEY